MAVVLGYGGDVTLGGTALKVREWSGDLVGEEIDTTSKASGAWREHVIGIQHLEGTVTALWDSSINSSAPPYALVQPQAGVAFVLNIGQSVGQGKYTFTGVISKLSIKSAFEGAVEYTFDFKSSGAVAYAVA